MTEVLDSVLKIGGFDLQSLYYDHFRTDILG